MQTQQTCQPQWGPILRGLVADKSAKHYAKMKNSLWLYIFFIATVNHKTGKTTSTLEAIAAEISVDLSTVRSWLGQLRKHHYVKTKKANDQTIFQVCGWSKVRSLFERIPMPESGLTGYKSIPEAKKAAKKQEFEDPIAKKARLLAVELEDENSLAYLKKVCEKYPEHFIQKALNQVKAIPDEKIKRSRGALFTYLIKKYADKKTESSARH